MFSRKNFQTGEIELILDSESDYYSEDEEEHETPLPPSPLRQLCHYSNNHHRTGGRFPEPPGDHAFTIQDVLVARTTTKRHV
jgi:hypothetical protein